MHGDSETALLRTGSFSAGWGALLALCLFAAQAKAGEPDPEQTLRQWIIEGAKPEAGVYVFVDFMGRPVRAALLGADERGIKVEAAGTELEFAWADIPPKRFLGIARRFAEDKPFGQQALLVHYATAEGLNELAGKEAERLLEQNPLLYDVLFPPEQPASAPAEETRERPEAAGLPATPETGSIGVRPPPAPAGALSIAAIPKDHPRCFMRRQPLGDARTAAQALAAAKRNPGALNRNSAAQMALDFLLSGSRSSADLAIQLMKKPGKMGWYDAGRWTADYALAYDWLCNYPGFTQQDRQAAEDVIVKGLLDCNKWVRPGGDVHHIWNGYWICAQGALTAAVALYGHRQEATSCAQEVINSVDQALLSLDHCDGAWNEGPTYATHSLNHMVPAAEVLWSATGQNPYKRHPGMARFIHWFLWMTRPDWTLARWDDCSGGSSSSTNLELAVFAHGVALGSGDGLAAWYAKRLVDKWGADAWYPEGYAHYMRFLADTGAVGAIARPPAKLSEVFSPNIAGFVMARSDWSDNAFHLVFRCGDCIVPGHQHYCAGSFTVYHFGPQAMDSGEYHGQPLHAHMVNYASTTVAHNAIIFPDPARPDEDAGQDRRHRGGLSSAAGLLNAGKYEAGRIIAYDDKGAYVYAAGDATRAYPSGFCRFWVREIVYLRPNVLVVMDRVVPGGNRVPTWVMHFNNEPRVQGNVFSAEEGSGRIWGRFVLPAQVQIDKVGGKGKEFWNKGKNWTPGGRSSTYHEGGRWRIEAASKSGPGPFLTIIQTDRKGSAPPSVTAVTEGGVGVSVAGRTVTFRSDAVGLVGVR